MAVEMGGSFKMQIPAFLQVAEMCEEREQRLGTCSFKQVSCAMLMPIHV